MPSLAPVLVPADLPWAELQAARLDGDLYDLAGAFCLLGELEAPRHRARAVLAGRSPRLIAELGTAAWIWGAGPEPERPRFAVTPDARTRLAPATGVVVRELRFSPGDVAHLDGFAVTTPLRTVLDLARLDGDEYDAPLVARLAAVAGISRDDALAAARVHSGLPAMRRATERLAALPAQAVETR